MARVLPACVEANLADVERMPVGVVVHTDPRPVFLRCRLDATVLDIKFALMNTMGIHTAKQALWGPGKGGLLADDERVGDSWSSEWGTWSHLSLRMKILGVSVLVQAPFHSCRATTFLELFMPRRDSTVLDLKNKITPEFGIYAHDQQLMFRDAIMDDETLLTDYPHVDTFSPYAPVEAFRLVDLRLMTIVVHRVGERFRFEMWRQQTVWDVKQVLSEHEGMPVDEIGLTLRGVVLSNDRVLGDMGILAHEFLAFWEDRDREIA